MIDSKNKSMLLGGLIGICSSLGFLWLTGATESITRGEMVSYVKETATEHLRFLRADINEMRRTLDDIKTKVTTIEAGLIGRESDGQ